MAICFVAWSSGLCGVLHVRLRASLARASHLAILGRAPVYFCHTSRHKRPFIMRRVAENDWHSTRKTDQNIS